MLSNPRHIAGEAENKVYASIISGELHDENLDDFAIDEVCGSNE